MDFSSVKWGDSSFMPNEAILLLCQMGDSMDL